MHQCSAGAHTCLQPAWVCAPPTDHDRCCVWLKVALKRCSHGHQCSTYLIMHNSCTSSQQNIPGVSFVFNFVGRDTRPHHCSRLFFEIAALPATWNNFSSQIPTQPPMLDRSKNTVWAKLGLSRRFEYQVARRCVMLALEDTHTTCGV